MSRAPLSPSVDSDGKSHTCGLKFVFSRILFQTPPLPGANFFPTWRRSFVKHENYVKGDNKNCMSVLIMYLVVLLVTLTFRLFGQEVTEIPIYQARTIRSDKFSTFNIIYKHFMVRKRWLPVIQIKDYPYVTCDLHFLYAYTWHNAKYLLLDVQECVN